MEAYDVQSLPMHPDYPTSLALENQKLISRLKTICHPHPQHATDNQLLKSVIAEIGTARYSPPPLIGI